MMYYRTTFGPNTIEKLLDRLEIAEAAAAVKALEQKQGEGEGNQKTQEQQEQQEQEPHQGQGDNDDSQKNIEAGDSDDTDDGMVVKNSDDEDDSNDAMMVNNDDRQASQASQANNIRPVQLNHMNLKRSNDSDSDSDSRDDDKKDDDDDDIDDIGFNIRGKGTSNSDLSAKSSSTDVNCPTLDDFLSDEDLLPELRSSNSKLVDYVCRYENLKTIVSNAIYIDSQYTQDLNSPSSQKQFKNAFVSSEVLAIENALISDKIMKNKELIDLLFSYFSNPVEEKYQGIFSAYFLKAFSNLNRQAHYGMLDYLKEHEEIFDLILQNLHMGPISEIIVRLFDNPDTERTYGAQPLAPTKQSTEYLAVHDLLETLAELFLFSSYEADTFFDESTTRQNESTLNFISNMFISIARRAVENILVDDTMDDKLNPYVNTEPVAILLRAGVMSSQSRPSSALLHALNVVTFLINFESNIGQKNAEGKIVPAQPKSKPLMIRSKATSRRPIGGNLEEKKKFKFTPPEEFHNYFLLSIKPIEKSIMDILPDVTKIYFEEGKKIAVQLGTDEPHPLGTAKLKIAEFFAALIKKGGSEILQAMESLEIPSRLLKSFPDHELNNILHTVVSTSILNALESGNELAQSLWVRQGLIDTMINMWTECALDNVENESNRGHKGYRGHLIRISSGIHAFLEKFPSISLFPEDQKTRFIEFYEQHVRQLELTEDTPLGKKSEESEEKEGSDDDIFEEPTEVFGVDDVLGDLYDNENEHIEEIISIDDITPHNDTPLDSLDFQAFEKKKNPYNAMGTETTQKELDEAIKDIDSDEEETAEEEGSYDKYLARKNPSDTLITNEVATDSDSGSDSDDGEWDTFVPS